MQFVAGGPDVPNALLQAHEEGRVVFFCGAGISVPAGLPSFEELVQKTYEDLGCTKSKMEEAAFTERRYDTVFELLEGRLEGKRPELRRAVARILVPKLRRRGARDTHSALLSLARCRSGGLRLVTTNFDRVFESLRTKKSPHRIQVAPFLPIPKASKWDGLVYLHGLLPKDGNAGALNQLVLTSGDFGTAYLTERWAARFVGELFRNFVVCFVGYSLGDPVLRYMMDALAADRRQGERGQKVYAFGEFGPEGEEEKRIEWLAKGVTPILYRGSDSHSALHATLKEWARIYSSGIGGRESLVVEHAIANPTQSTLEDDFVGRVLWAISHDSELPAKRFAELVPVPPFGWLEELAKARYAIGDLDCFKIAEANGEEEELTFSLLRRPCPKGTGSLLVLAGREEEHGRWDAPMHHFARWLLRHLGNWRLLLWVSRAGGRLHPRLAGMIGARLAEINRWEKQDPHGELASIREGAPDAVPSAALTTMWRFFLAGRIASFARSSDLYDWVKLVSWSGLTATARAELRRLLSPQIQIEEPWKAPWTTEDENARPLDLRSWSKVVPASSHASTALQHGREAAVWKQERAELVGDFQIVLRETLDLLRELGKADGSEDGSTWELLSIEPHAKNQGFGEWGFLIELCRDSWLAVLTQDPQKARSLASEWFAIPYPVFKRLALFAATRAPGISGKQWVEWLLADHARCLWSSETKRETMRLLVQRGADIRAGAQRKLEAAILKGPPREVRERRKKDDWGVWLRLAKLRASGAVLGMRAAGKLDAISEANPAWAFEPYEREEFWHWSTGTGEPDYDEIFPITRFPRDIQGIARVMEELEGKQRTHDRDDYEDVCKEHPLRCGAALSLLATKNVWPQGFWRRTLNSWTARKKIKRIWKIHGPFIGTVPDEILSTADNAFGYLLKRAVAALPCHQATLYSLCRRVLAQPWPEREEQGDPVGEAINHPVGHVAEALLDWCFSAGLRDDQRLRKRFATLFTWLCNVNHEKFRHGRVILASRVVTLFRVDSGWCEANLLPLFDWETSSAEAAGAWRGYLWSPRLHPMLQLAWKKSFLGTAAHYGKLGEHGSQYAAVLTLAALARTDGYGPEDFREAFKQLPDEGLYRAAKMLAQRMESVEGKEVYWDQHILPFWKKIWPHDRRPDPYRISQALAAIAIASGDRFENAVATFEFLFKRCEFPAPLIEKLRDSNLCPRFPEVALSLLDLLVQESRWGVSGLAECLEQIANAKPSLASDPRFLKLKALQKNPTG